MEDFIDIALPDDETVEQFYNKGEDEEGVEILLSDKEEIQENPKKDIRIEIENLIKKNIKFNILLIDPAYDYGNINKEKFTGCANNHYETIADENLKNLKIDKICEEDAIILLWSTAPKLNVAFDLIKAWNMQYITILFVWEKQRKNSIKHATTIGNYTRGTTEFLLMCKKSYGLSSKKFFRPQKQIVTNLIKTFDEEIKEEVLVQQEVGIHSQKPEIIYYLIDKLFYNVKKAELFSRTERVDFYSIGNQKNKFYTNFKKKENEKILKIQKFNHELLKKFKSYEETSKLFVGDLGKIYTFQSEFKKRKRRKCFKKKIKQETLSQFFKKKKLKIIKKEGFILSQEF